MIKSISVAMLAALSLPLCACSGGGSRTGSMPPAPIDPADQRNINLTDLKFSETLFGDQAGMKYQLSATGAASNFNANGGGATNILGVRYDAAKQSYTIVGYELETPAFGPAQRTTSNATLTNYESKSGTKQENLTLFNAGNGNTRLALTYASFGAYQVIDTGNGLNVGTTFFSYGVRTNTSDMPRTGSASYNTIVDGLFADSSGVYSLGGDSSFEANFAALTVSSTLSLRGRHVTTGAEKVLAPQSLSGSIWLDTDGPHFSAEGGNLNTTHSTVLGRFYGPAAAEMGGVFYITTPDGRGTGAIVGKKK